MFALFMILILSACVPVTSADSQQGPSVVLINAPTENAVAGLADALEEMMLRDEECCAFWVHWSAPVRAQERQRDFFDHRAWISAGSLARNLGAEWAILIGVNNYERTVTEHRDSFHIVVSAGVRLHVLDSTGQELARFDSRTFTDSRVQSNRQPLADEQFEPLLLPVARNGLADVAGAAVSELNWLASAAAD